MRHFLLTGALGLLLLIGLFYYSGVDQIAQSFAAIGWGLGVVVLLRFAKVAGAAWAWAFLFPATKRLAPGIVYGLRLIREGINTLLPVAQVGGEFVGARLAARNGLSIGEAGASVAVDLLSQAVTQAVFNHCGHSGARVARRRADDGPRRRADAARARAGIDRLFSPSSGLGELAG